jgi:hypothetical protein
LRKTRFGDFDLNPAPGQELIPRNYGLGPSFFAVNMGISRSFMFGNVPGSAAAAAPPAGATPAPAQGQAAGARPGGGGGGPQAEKRYTLTFSANILNLLNSTNLSNPIGNLSSPRFGESTSTSGSFGFGPSGSAAAGNRRIQFQVRLGF